MKKYVRGLLLLAILLTLEGRMAKAEQVLDRKGVIGVTHTGGKYCLTEKDFLAEGADEVLKLGSKVLKLWFIHPEKQYPFHSEWTVSSSLVEQAKTPYFRFVFQRPFQTYVLVVYSMGQQEHYWRDGISKEQVAEETRQFYKLTRYLLDTYENTGKTFVLQHWEGDWAIRSAYEPNVDPKPEAIQGMIQWLRARQAGVDRARKEFKGQGVRVFHAAEVNLVVKSMMEGRPNVVNSVLPHVKLDLVSYSSWDSAPQGDLFRKALDYIAENVPDSEAFGAKNVYVGEFGAPENDFSPEKYQDTIRNVVQTSLDWRCPYVIFWQIYCNEARNTPVKTNEDCRGFWLIRPDGSRSWAWDYLEEVLRVGERKCLLDNRTGLR